MTPAQYTVLERLLARRRKLYPLLPREKLREMMTREARKLNSPPVDEDRLAEFLDAHGLACPNSGPAGGDG